MNRAGIYVDNLIGESAYQSFKPSPLPPLPELTMDEELEVSYNTAATAVKKLVELGMGILEETTNAARNRVFAYEEYLEILRKNT